MNTISNYSAETETNEFYCDRCGKVVVDKADLFPYEDMYVCESCLDILRLSDENVLLEMESDGMEDYDN